MKKSLRACRCAEMAVGSGSDACGVVRGVTPFLRDDSAYQQAADAGWSGRIGVGGDAQVRARAGASALSSALAAMLKDALIESSCESRMAGFSLLLPLTPTAKNQLHRPIESNQVFRL